MANSTNQDWDINSPAGTDAQSDGDNEIRVLRDATGDRLAKEHIAPAALGVGGEHKAGSAVAYIQSGAPTLQPDAATALASTADDGRLWVDLDDFLLYVWESDAFTLVAAGLLGADVVIPASIADDAVQKEHLAADVVNATGGLQQEGDGSLSIDIEAAGGLELTTNEIGIKDAGVTAAMLASGVATESYAKLSDEKTSGTEGGASVSGSFETRDLNTEVDTDGIVSLSANQFTLQAGTYKVNWMAPAYFAIEHQSRLWNDTDSAVEILGANSRAPTSSGMVNNSIGFGRFTIADAKVFEVQHQVANSNANGHGRAASFGTELYTQIEILKEA